MNSHSDSEIETRASLDESEEHKENSPMANPSEFKEKHDKGYHKLDTEEFKEQLHARTIADRDILGILSVPSRTLIDRIRTLKEKQSRIDLKLTKRENRGQKLENKAERYAATNKMLKDFFSDKEMPPPVKAIYELNARRIAKIKEVKIPDNNRKIEKLQVKGINNQRKIRATFATIDKLQSLSGVIKSFSILNPEKRRAVFAQSLDALHNASKRALQCKIEKCDMRIQKLQKSLPEREIDYSISDINAEEKISALNEKKAALSEKLQKLESLEKPFAEQSDKALEDVTDTAQKTINILENAGDISEKQYDRLTEDLCASCVDTVTATPIEQEKPADISKDEYDKLDLPNKGILLAEYKSEHDDHDQSWTSSSHLYQLNERFYYDSSDGYNIGSDIYQELNNDQMKSKLNDYVASSEKGYYGSHYSVTEAGKKLLDSNSAENKMPKQKDNYKIIGNTNYNDISDKFYVNLTAEKAEEISKLLDANGVQFSGTIRDNGEAKITLNKSDIKLYKQIASSVQSRKPSVIDEIGKIHNETQKKGNTRQQREKKSHNQSL
ncbi:MAG: hypothetical protein ACI4JS_03225 [Oscillospiraceae bacterium]